MAFGLLEVILCYKSPCGDYDEAMVRAINRGISEKVKEAIGHDDYCLNPQVKSGFDS